MKRLLADRARALIAETYGHLPEAKQIRTCGVNVTRGLVDVAAERHPKGYAYTTGLQTCKSVWACPICSFKIRTKRAIEIAVAIAVHHAKGGSVFENLVISDTAYELLFQESELVYVFEQGVYGDDREQDKDRETGYPLWMVGITASDAANREEQTLEVQVAPMEQPAAGFKEKVLLPNLRVQMYSRKTERNITAKWYADTFNPSRWHRPQGAQQKGERDDQDARRSSGVADRRVKQATAAEPTSGRKEPAWY